MWKDFFYYSKAERRIILFLFVTALGFICMGVYLSGKKSAQYMSHGENGLIDSFLVHVKPMSYAGNKNVLSASEKNEVDNYRLQYFDPNTVDSLTLRRMGLSGFTARNVLRYREKGGVFRDEESFSRIYGLTSEQFRVLRPYIVIKKESRKSQDTVPVFERKPRILSEKYPEGTVLDLNKADTNALKRVPGIGSVLSKRIVAYRERLGGFYEVKQLQDLSHIGEEVNRWFCVKADSLRKLEINKAGLEELRRHPYMNFYRAKAILEYRRKRGKIKSLSQLSLFEEFSGKDLLRLSPYLSFE